ncbi:hypothetical protein [Crocosphaera chwakensis]|uniref:Uncharacterized protein n=1 Tax=Crocosphaera chwakensis CCY0110 TaxID=391612 RepID=A3IYE4_9CHRO|nr:hypothetical protein [Crocosphaera chwakensis]EAZ88516.1 hypothetical protein CY0110_06989 [Crocosphaera chwakensis CCY0110]
MNPNNNLNSVENTPNQTGQTPNNQGDQPIDAEIIAETQTNPSRIDEDGNTINLTYYPVQEDQTSQLNDDPLVLWLKQGLISLSTPWGIGSLSLIVVANLIIGGVQLWKMQQTPQEPESANLSVDTSASNLSIPKSLNIARTSSDRVMLDALSTVSTPSPQSPQTVATTPQTSQSLKETVVNVNQPPSLTNAILPPSLQSQTPNQYPITTSPLKVPQVPKTATVSPSTIPVSEIPRPVPSSPKPTTVPTIAIEPPPPPTSDATMSEDEQVRQAIKQQLKIEENNQTNIPLGFNHKTRVEMQNGMNELPEELLPKQVKHLEQLQQREVLDSETSQGINIQ